MRRCPNAITCVLAVVVLGCAARSSDPTETQPSAAEPRPASAHDPTAATPGSAAPIAPRRGPTCLPVAQCSSFAKERCALLRFDDAGTQLEPGPELEFVRAWPNEPGIGPSIKMAMDYFESQQSCRRHPLLQMPPFDCVLQGDACVARALADERPEP